jgi:ABC-type branched-subunit amino acid transport system substrate-binding protein
MRRTTISLAVLTGLTALIVIAGAQTAAARPHTRTAVRSGANEVVVARGQPVEFAFTADTTQGDPFGAFTASAENAIRMAIERHPTIRGFPIQMNPVETLCLDGDNTASAETIVGNPQNTAVLGNLCSAAYQNALPIYQAAGLVTISGSASASYLPPLGPTVFNRTIVISDAAGDAGDTWLSQISTLPSVLQWNEEYTAEFGAGPALTPLPALYFDAASLLITRLQQTSQIVNGHLVIDRAALASAVRNTTNYQGVTCTITLDPTTGNRVNDPAALTRCATAEVHRH